MASQTIAIPDANFENYLETHDADGGLVEIGDANSMGDGIANNNLVFTASISDVLFLNVSNQEIYDLSGIEGFTGLENLICDNNNLSSLDVSNNTNLTSLLCGANLLPSLDVVANVNLEDLDCSDNQISTFAFADAGPLKSINCSNNRIDAIDVSQLSDLTSLSISNNRISTVFVGNNGDLESLFCASNQITTLDLASNTNLKVLDVSGNTISILDLSTLNTMACPEPQTDPITACQGVSSINVSNNQLTSLIVANGFNDLISSFTSEGNPELVCIQIDAGFTPSSNWEKDDWAYYTETTCEDIYTYVPDNNFEQELINQGYDDVLDDLVLTDIIDDIEILDVSNSNIESLVGIEDFDLLVTLNCSNNDIEDLDISNNIVLENCNVSGNNIKTLDLSANTEIEVLDVSSNALSDLDIANNIDLINLNCSDNSIQFLDLSNHPAITDFNCDANSLNFLSIKNGQNVNLINFSAINNADLFCIETDTGVVPAGVNWSIDATAAYSDTCGTYVPDNNFEQALITAGIDVDGLNNFVSTANIIAYNTPLDISDLGISDLTGIEAFTTLPELNCARNNISELNLTSNSALTSITCNNNALLEFVDIRNNNNTNITVFNATNNPNLFCINVDAAVEGNIPGSWMVDPIADFNSNCQNNRFTPIPDNNFELALIDLGIDSGMPDNQVLTANIEYLTSLNISGRNIESLQGIKAFTSLMELDCSNNYLDELDVSNMVNLEALYCGSNYFLTNDDTNTVGLLNTTGTINLRNLFCANNNLADLNITLHTNLQQLDCSNNKLMVLDISANNNLVEVNCDNNQISNFIGFTVNNASLTHLSCTNNELSTLPVDRCIALTHLDCRSNALNTLIITSNVSLEVIDFSDNEITDVDFSANTNLIAVSGSNNQLTEVNDLSSTVLESLIIDNNAINALTTVLNNLPAIKYLSVSSNQLADLNATTNFNLIELNVSNNALTDLQLATNLNQLKSFNCSNNTISGAIDLSSMGSGTCPAKNDKNPLDFCPDTITINVSGNQLEFVNIQNGINGDVSGFSATNNPNLTCIQVDDVNAIGDSWVKDTTTEYSIDCRFGETYVPDDNFEQRLIDLGYDVGPLDDYVPTINIESVTNLDVSGNNIEDLTGIEDFIDLQNLNCSSNRLSTIDISNNTELEDINCSGNTIESLDVTNSPKLININIANNNFAVFDATLIPALEVFNCDGNNIIELHFITNTSLVNLSCASNTLEVLDLQNGQNPSILNLNAQNNPDLTCIQTDNGTAPTGVTWLKDTTTNYAIDCHFGETYVPDDNFEQALIDLGYDVEPLNDYVPTSNIQNLSFLNISGREITDVTGIEDFEGLRNLNFQNNTIASIDLSSNLQLISINASENLLSDLDISNQSNLSVLNISDNNFTQINFSANLGLTELNVSGNSFAVLDVSQLADLEKLNCASNQLTELDVTLNTRLVELFCSSNLFFQDNLNIQNGANEMLATFNASNNPDLSCILVDDPVAVIANTGGVYDNWFKDTTASYQTICDDADNDGVANEDDLCPGTTFGEPVDLFGCPFGLLPEDNFTILITGETCLNNNDGKINIITKELYEYKANLKGEDFDRDYTFTNEIDILNLLAGTYRLCITSEELPNFQRCFNVVINHPEHLEVITAKRSKGKAVDINMSGSSNYTVNFNGLEFTTTESKITLQLENGKNTIKVFTDLPCQGKYEESFLLADSMFVYPNPFKNQLNIYLREADSETINIAIYSYLGQLVFSKHIKANTVRDVNINTQYLSDGLYTIFVKSNSSVANFKIVKK
ncbi:hypothetical protein MHTCC0001_11790 [Flavobacteriaceae bacterium MHTCC 0001]